MYLHFFCVWVCVFLCKKVCSFCVTCKCVRCRTWALSVSRSCRSCQISGIYKSWQWKTDHQASSCHTSILPRASKDSLQHALLIPMLLQTKLSVSFHWFYCCILGAAWQQETWLRWYQQICMYLQGHIFVLFEFMLSLTPLWMTLPPVYSSYISCCELSATSSWFHLCLFA